MCDGMGCSVTWGSHWRVLGKGAQFGCWRTKDLRGPVGEERQDYGTLGIPYFYLLSSLLIETMTCRSLRCSDLMPGECAWEEKWCQRNDSGMLSVEPPVDFLGCSLSLFPHSQPQPQHSLFLCLAPLLSMVLYHHWWTICFTYSSYFLLVSPTIMFLP